MNRLVFSKDMVFRIMIQMGLIATLAGALGLGVNQIRPHGIPLVKQGSSGAGAVSEHYTILSLEQAKQAHLSGEALFLDARSPQQYADGHIQGARNLPWNEMDKHYEQVLAGVSYKAMIITYCDGESCDLSEFLARELFFRGYENVHVLKNGWTLWEASRFPIGRGPDPGR